MWWREVWWWCHERCGGGVVEDLVKVSAPMCATREHVHMFERESKPTHTHVGAREPGECRPRLTRNVTGSGRRKLSRNSAHSSSLCAI